MGIIVNNDEKRSQLQKRIHNDLQEKMKKKALEIEQLDGVEDSRYIEGTKATTSLAWVWILIIIATVALLISLIVQAYS